MAQVKFLKGKSQNLSKLPLDHGTVYFTTDDRKLYIDTAVARLPVAGDSGRIFYIKINGKDLMSQQGWPKNIKTTEFYNNKGDLDSYIFADVLDAVDPIVFCGVSSAQIEDSSKKYSVKIIINSIQPQDKYITGEGDILANIDLSILDCTDEENKQISESDLSKLTIWVQLYTPNPNSAWYTSGDYVYKTVHSFSDTLYGRDNLAQGISSNWVTNFKSDKTVDSITYSYVVADVNLEVQPFIIDLYRDMNFIYYPQYRGQIGFDVSYNKETNESTITFKLLNTTLQKPFFDINFHMVIFLSKGNTGDNDNCWWSATITKKMAYSEYGNLSFGWQNIKNAMTEEDKKKKYELYSSFSLHGGGQPIDPYSISWTNKITEDTKKIRDIRFGQASYTKYDELPFGYSSYSIHFDYDKSDWIKEEFIVYTVFLRKHGKIFSGRIQDVEWQEVQLVMDDNGKIIEDNRALSQVENWGGQIKTIYKGVLHSINGEDTTIIPAKEKHIPLIWHKQINNVTEKWVQKHVFNCIYQNNQLILYADAKPTNDGYNDLLFEFLIFD